MPCCAGHGTPSEQEPDERHRCVMSNLSWPAISPLAEVLRASSIAQIAQIFGGANTLGVCEDSRGEGKDKARGRRGCAPLPPSTSMQFPRSGGPAQSVIVMCVCVARVRGSFGFLPIWRRGDALASAFSGCTVYLARLRLASQSRTFLAAVELTVCGRPVPRVVSTRRPRRQPPHGVCRCNVCARHQQSVVYHEEPPGAAYDLPWGDHVGLSSELKVLKVRRHGSLAHFGWTQLPI